MTEAPAPNALPSDPRAPSELAPDPRVAVAKRIVTRLAMVVLFTLFVSFVFAVIHLATDRPVKDVLGL